MAVVLTLLGTLKDASAQTEPNAKPTLPLDTYRSLSAVVWNADCKEGPITLDQLAQRARPVLWFSRDEPLVFAQMGNTPSLWPDRKGADRSYDGVDGVQYFRIRKIKGNGTSKELVDFLTSQKKLSESDVRTHYWMVGFPTRLANPEAVAKIEWQPSDLQRVHKIIVRYMFYYPSELGTGAHPNDLESVEVQIDRVDKKNEGPACTQLRVAKVSGSAHGLGLYTNTLDFDKVRTEHEGEESFVRPPDPAWPPVILVEEGKHASAPDRNGDGVYTPGYDVNVNAPDAWGVRDTIRTSTVSPAYRAEMAKQRVETIDGRVYLRRSLPALRATADAEVCGASADHDSRDTHLETYSKVLRNNQRAKPLAWWKKPFQMEDTPKDLLTSKGFCSETSLENRFNFGDVGSWFGFGGQFNGYTRWYERFSGSLRFDGGSGTALYIPIAAHVPYLGGWAIVRATAN